MTGLCRSGKTGSWPTRAEADAVLASIREENELTGSSRKTPTQAYECKWCGDWHLSTQPVKRSRR